MQRSWQWKIDIEEERLAQYQLDCQARRNRRKANPSHLKVRGLHRRIRRYPILVISIASKVNMSQLLYTQDTDVSDSLTPTAWLRKNGLSIDGHIKNFQYLVRDTSHTIYWIGDKIVTIENAYGYEISISLITKQECLQMIEEGVSLIHPTAILYKEQSDNEAILLYTNEHNSKMASHEWLYENGIDKLSTVIYHSQFNEEILDFILHENHCLIVYQGCDGESITQTTSKNAAQSLVNSLISK